MRGVASLLGLVVLTWLEFQVYPGHSYLQGETQFYVPMLERLDTPGFLSRDLVATNPTFAYTVYDEITLFLHQGARLTLRRALGAQQLLVRFAAMLGIYLLLRSTGMGRVSSLVMAAVVNAVTALNAPAMFLTNPEAVPSALALGLVLLAMGAVADEKPLLGGFAGGAALLYEPVIAGAFWLVILMAMLADSRMRRMLRPMLPLLLVFVLLLANLSQLQPGVGSVKELGSRLSPAMAALSRMRTPALWPSLWVGREVWSYLFLFVAMLWAAARVWKRLTRQVRWLAIGMACAGLLSVAVSALLLEGWQLEMAAQMPPERVLVFVVVMALALCGTAAWQALRMGGKKEAAVWALLVVWMMVNPEVLSWRGRAGAVTAEDSKRDSVRQLAAWADRETWGSSMFLFPDAARSSNPGRFRALSRRALWTDWGSGALVNFSDEAGLEWWRRWQMTMQKPYSAALIQSWLGMPVDYYVFQGRHRLKGIRSAFENQDFVAYDAQDLRNAGGPFETQ